MFLAVGLALVLALGFVFVVQRLSSNRHVSSLWKETLLYHTFYSPRTPVPDTEVKLFQDVKPYNFPPIRERTSTKMAMGLKRLDESNWLTLDSAYLPEHFLRCHLLCTKRPQVLQTLPGSEAACQEVLSLVVTFLSSRFPQHFTLTTTSLGGPAIHNHLTNEIFPIGQQKCHNPLEIAAKLSMEDFNILVKNQETGEYELKASATLFPAGWKLQERIGTSMANLHRPVPGWKEKLGGSVNRYFRPFASPKSHQKRREGLMWNRYFDHLSPKTCMERTNLFIQTTTDLFQDSPEAVSSDEVIRPERLMVRRERQTFMRLVNSGAVLFTVRTYITPLVELGVEELRALKSQVLGWEDEIRVYKGWDIWGEALMRWCDERLGGDDEKGEGNEGRETRCEVREGIKVYLDKQKA